MSVRLWVRGPRLPFGFRVGVSVPVGGTGRPRRSQPSSPSPQISYVYVIESAAGVVKVGYSTNPQMRLMSLQTSSASPLRLANVLATDIDGRMIEAEAHRLLDRHRLAGEWFDVSSDVAFEAVGQAARNMGMPVITTDSAKLMEAVIEGKTSVNDFQKSTGKPLDVGFASEMALYAIGTLMVAFGSMGYLNSKTDEPFVGYFIIGLVLAFPFFTGGLIVRIFRKVGR